MMRFNRFYTRCLTTAVILLLLSQPAHALRDRRMFYGEEPTQSMTLILTGDLMMHATQYLSSEDPKDPSRYNFKPWFHYMMGLFSSADYVIGNFETTITENPAHYSGYPMFRSPHAIARDLNYAGFNVMVMANNHSLDNGLYGVETSLKHLRSQNILTTGTYLRDEIPIPLIIEKNGLRIGIINATYGTNGVPLPRDYPHVVNLMNESTFDTQIAHLKESKVDGILCFVHWGDEYQRSPNAYQKRWASHLNEKGVDWVIGAHPHSIQPEAYLENSKGHKTYVNYSLGNMISNQRWRYSDTGLALKLVIERKEGYLDYAISHHPFWVDKEDEHGNVAYTMLPLKTPYPLSRLSPKDVHLMKEALADFYELYPHAKTIKP
jgi:poly-gamma-glutamate capsule biosynthesis protein CapA/YwtB (metallophosphatase superfamily)